MRLRNKFKVVNIKKKTNTKIFGDLNVGDKFTISMKLDGCYHRSPMATVKNDLTGDRGDIYLSQIYKVLRDNIEVVEVSYGE